MIARIIHKEHVIDQRNSFSDSMQQIDFKSHQKTSSRQRTGIMSFVQMDRAARATKVGVVAISPECELMNQRYDYIAKSGRIRDLIEARCMNLSKDFKTRAGSVICGRSIAKSSRIEVMPAGCAEDAARHFLEPFYVYLAADFTQAQHRNAKVLSDTAFTREYDRLLSLSAD